MKSLTKIIWAIFFLIAWNNLKAQYDPMFTQYGFNKMFINPAYAGSQEAVSLTALDRVQWVNFPGAPNTLTFSAHAPLFENTMGVGLTILNEKIGVLNRGLYYASYAYRFKVGPGKLSFGLQGGVTTQLEKLQEVKTTNGQDGLFSQNTPRVILPNFSFGTYYYTDRFFVGFSIPRMINNQVKINTDNSIDKKSALSIDNFHYYLVFGYVFDVASGIKLRPQVMTHASQNAPVECEINLSALLNEKLWLGVSYRTSADFSGIIGLQISPQLLVSYSYDYSLTSVLRNYNSGSHEIALSYLFSFTEKKKITSPRYF